MGDSPNPSSALFLFFVVTTVYFIIKYNLAGNSTLIVTLAYVLSIIIGELFVNLSLTNVMCGENQWGTAFSITLAPWIVIFGLLIIMLDMFPGWKRPFSNTIGYGVALLGGISSVVKQIFKDPQNVSGNDSMQQSIQYIYRDQSLLVNEIGEGPENFENFWNNMKNAMKPGIYANNVEGSPKKQLENLVNIKYLTSEYIWYMLTGALVTSISYNYLVNIGCSYSAKKMLNRREAYNRKVREKQAAEAERDKNQGGPKISD